MNFGRESQGRGVKSGERSMEKRSRLWSKGRKPKEKRSGRSMIINFNYLHYFRELISILVILSLNSKKTVSNIVLWLHM
jgi:hypothetical protein